ncbi:dynamin family protein [Speluncibacter jeojiensis]|uniref:50S ribosome-binding GTPase n=1 Tax=Speluncibacter jeojiensis TaxID=2710754 RepID=A0A9X4M118_9ACTN|nr:50S ribosome-binding GTPase [Corynebacteriales bacterium D3-21]
MQPLPPPAAQPGTPPMDPVVAVLDRALRSLAAPGGDLVGHANRIGAMLWSPPRIVVVGRLKAGKSTLVNALIGAPVAETAALEATNVVTVYHDGAPSRAEVVGHDGTRRAVPIDLRSGAPVEISPVDTAYVDRYLPSAAIRDLTLIDTPGLATLTVANADTTRRALIDGFAQTKDASVDADAAVFLFDSTPRADEVAFLRELGFTPLNTLGVLSRADGFGEGAFGTRDPIEHAHEHARRLADQLAGQVLTVLPVAGLLSESARTGRVTEADARALAALSGIEGWDLYRVLSADDPAPMTAPQRDRILDLLGEYGAVNGRAAAAQGAHALAGWLDHVSGLPVLQSVLHNNIGAFAAVHRARRILAELDTLASSHPDRDHIRAVTQQARTDPAMNPVLLLQALRSMLATDPHSPVTAELTRTLQARTDAERVGLPPGAGWDQVRGATADRIAWVQRQAITTRSAAEDAALTALTVAYNLQRLRLGG